MILLMTLSLGMSSCFEIIEEINLNKDGSGSVLYTLNLSQSKAKITQVMKLDTINGFKVPSEQEIKDSITTYFNMANTMSGVSNVKKTENFEEMIFSFACDFQDVESLNKMAKSMGKKTPNDPNINKKHYQYLPDGKTFSRSGDYSIKKEFDKLRSIDKAVFDNVNYTSIFRSETTIKSTENSNSIMAPTRKAVMIRIPILEILNERKNLSNTIILN